MAFVRGLQQSAKASSPVLDAHDVHGASSTSSRRRSSPTSSTFLEQIVPRDAEWLHNDPAHSDCDRLNADAHLRAMLLGHESDAAGERRRNRAGPVAAHPDGRARRPERADAAMSRVAWDHGSSTLRPWTSIQRPAPQTQHASRLHRLGLSASREARRRRAAVVRRRRAAVRVSGSARASAGSPIASASGGTARAPTTTSTCGSRRPTSASRAACSARSRGCKPGDADAYTMSLEQVFDKLRAARRSAAHRSPRRQRPASRPAVLLLPRPAARAEGDPSRHSSEVLHGRRDRVLRRHVRHDRRAGAARR